MNEDLSNIFEKLNINKDSISPDMINNIMGMLNNDNSNTSSSSSANSDIDIDTILKMKSLFEKMNNSNDPRSNLLQSLRPYLKESRQSKLDQYIQMSKILQILPLINGDNNANK